MDKVSLWCKVIALISILSSIILLILPENKTKKAFKMLLSFIMIYAFTSPLAGGEIDFTGIDDYFNTEINFSTSEDFEKYEYYPLISAAETETEEYFNNLLVSLGISGECESVFEYKSEKILLKEITFYARTGESQKEAISAEVYKIYGDDAIISFSGE